MGKKNDRKHRSMNIDWFSIHSEEDTCTVSFQASTAANAQWLPEVMVENKLPARLFQQKKVLLEGRAPLWMYAHAAVVAQLAGAKSIAVWQPHVQATVVYPLSMEPSEQHDWIRYEHTNARRNILYFQLPEELVSPADFFPLLISNRARWSQQEITLTGKAPNWIYAATAAMIASRQSTPIYYYAPRDGYSICLNANPETDIRTAIPPSLLSDQSANGKIIGIVGDPNSGKSVFSLLLHDGLRQIDGRLCWRLDCDHASPTPNWYIQMLANQQIDEATKLRKKREWTHDAELSLASQLKNCTQSINWVIADFPGGIHKEGHPSQRIPQGRDKLLEVADAFIVLGRADKPEAEKGWIAELTAHGMADKIIAIIDSSAPELPVNLTWNIHAQPIIRGICTGLDRSYKHPSINEWKLFAEALIQQIIT
jgi:hypothetical protein